MTDQRLIDTYLNELVGALSALGVLAGKRHTEVSLGDGVDTLLILRTCSEGKRISGIVDSLSSELKFEVRIRPRHLEFTYPPAGPRAMLRASILPAQGAPSPEDSATKVANLARRLKHFAVMKRVRLGIRDTLRPKGEEALAS